MLHVNKQVGTWNNLPTWGLVSFNNSPTACLGACRVSRLVAGKGASGNEVGRGGVIASVICHLVLTLCMYAFGPWHNS